MSRSASIDQLNQDFYAAIAKDFHATRQHPWPGFRNTLQWIKPSGTVLDIGCGNGRFLQFLLDHSFEGHYTGIDTNSVLLSHTPSYPKSNYKTTGWKDWIQQNTENFDTIIVFGVLHHISSFDDLLDLLDYYYHHSNTIILSRWNCIMNTSLMERRLDLESKEGKDLLKLYQLETEIWEPMEFLLDWKRGENAYRYVRYWTDQEIQQAVSKRGLAIIQTWIDDGKSSMENTYFVLQKQNPSTRTIVTN